jgi:hypothetical protein
MTRGSWPAVGPAPVRPRLARTRVVTRLATSVSRSLLAKIQGPFGRGGMRGPRCAELRDAAFWGTRPSARPPPRAIANRRRDDAQSSANGSLVCAGANQPMRACSSRRSAFGSRPCRAMLRFRDRERLAQGRTPLRRHPTTSFGDGPRCDASGLAAPYARLPSSARAWRVPSGRPLVDVTRLRRRPLTVETGTRLSDFDPGRLELQKQFATGVLLPS